MAAANRIYLHVQFDSADAEKNIDTLNKNIDKIGTTSEKATKQAVKGIKSVNVTVEQASDEMARLGRAVAALGIWKTTKEMVAMGEEVNRAKRQLAEIGLSDYAKKFSELAARTGSTGGEVRKMAMELRAAGVPAEELTKEVERILDMATAFSEEGVKGAKAMADVLRNIGTMFAPSAKGIQGLAAASNIAFPAKVAEAFNKQLISMKSEIKQLDPQQFMRLAIAVGVAGHEGAAAREALHTVSAAQNRLGSASKKLAGQIEDDLGPAFIHSIDMMTQMLKLATELVKVLGMLPGPIKDVAVAVGVFAGTAMMLGQVFNVLGLGFKGFGAAVTWLKGSQLGGVAGKLIAGAGVQGLGLAGAAAGAQAIATEAASKAAATAAASAAADAAAQVAVKQAASKLAREAAAKAASEVAAEVAASAIGEATAETLARRTAARAAAREAAKEVTEKIAVRKAADEAAKIAAEAAVSAAAAAAGARAAAGAGAAAAAGAGAGAGVTTLGLGAAGAGGMAIGAGTLLGMGPVGWVTLIGAIASAVWIWYAHNKMSDREKAAAAAVVTPVTPDEIARRRALAMRPNPEAIRSQLEESERALDEARARNLKAGKENIGALTDDYAGHFRKLGEMAKGVADYRKALSKETSDEARKNDIEAAQNQKDVQTAAANYARALWSDVGAELKKQREEARRDIRRTYEEIHRTRRQIAVAEAEVIPDETFAGRRRVLAVRAAATQQQAKADIIAKQVELDTQMQLEVAGIVRAGRAAGASQKQIDEDTIAAKEIFGGRIMALAVQLNDEIQKLTLDQEKETNALILDQRRQRMEQELQDRIAVIDRAATLGIARLQAQRQTSLSGRLDVIRRVTEMEEDQIIGKRNEQFLALEEDTAFYKRLYGEQSKSFLEIQEYNQKQFDRIRLDADTQYQMARLKGWQETDQAILQNQEQLFSNIKGFMEGMWDAVLDKSKSVWSSIGSFITRTMMGVLRNVVTNSLAAQLTTAFGGFQVGFPRGIWKAPYFPGAGSPPEITSIENAQSNLNFSVQTRNREMGEVVGRDLTRIVSDAAMADWDRRAAVEMAGTGSADAGSARQTGTAGGGGRGFGGFAQGLKDLRASFGIGGLVKTATGESVIWEVATPREKLASVMGSKGMASLASMVGAPMFLSSLNRRGVRAGAMGILGGAAAGWGIAQTFGATGLLAGAGAATGGGLGLLAAGWKRGGVSGLAMNIGGGALAGAGIGFMIGAMGGPIGALVGAAAGLLIGAGIGAGVGIARLFHDTDDEKVRKLLKQAYGIDMSDRGLREQIVKLAKERYGGDLRMAVFSTEVQDMVRLYALTKSQSTAGLPRPMYGATFAQSAAGGLQLQPVYSGGRLVSNPYVGTTTTQMAAFAGNQGGPLFLQLNPQQASSLFAGQVVQVLGSSPGAVSASNTLAARSGAGRQAQTSALLEPGTVLA
jgi:hypothetical protein